MSCREGKADPEMRSAQQSFAAMRHKSMKHHPRWEVLTVGGPRTHLESFWECLTEKSGPAGEMEMAQQSGGVRYPGKGGQGGWRDGVVISLSLSYLFILPPNAILMRIPPDPLLTAHHSETTADLLKFCVLPRRLCLNTYFDLSGYWFEIKIMAKKQTKNNAC